DLARIQLLYGERLRRAGATREARQQLYIALERFQWLGARPWTARAQDELRATGQASLPAEPSDVGRLTPREHQIAALAASGTRRSLTGWSYPSEPLPLICTGRSRSSA